MEITHAALDALQKQRRWYDDEIAQMREERLHYYERHGHTNRDWLDMKLAQVESERSGFIQAARIMGIDIR